MSNYISEEDKIAKEDAIKSKTLNNLVIEELEDNEDWKIVGNVDPKKLVFHVEV